ncbi:MAG TPA: hypothetical protein VHS36_08520 [Candidatus Limnocylindrales bacterium]|nr:hypothetical protein [Candidatus Limnocylindrales bacterium]
MADLVEPESLQKRAGEYLYRAGEVLRENGRVRIVELVPMRVIADVNDVETRSVVLEADGALRASCDCGQPSADGLCPHIVAVAIETWHRAQR